MVNIKLIRYILRAKTDQYLPVAQLARRNTTEMKRFQPMFKLYRSLIYRGGVYSTKRRPKTEDRIPTTITQKRRLESINLLKGIVGR